jgi:NAD-dependent deacetylase
VPVDKTIVVLTGAGISAESGLMTFRDNNGLWCNHRIEDVATPEAFARNPELVHEFYNMRRAQLKETHPNAAHMALAELQRDWPGRVVIVTQNVDDLHERAGASVLHMHGELKKARCIASEKIHEWASDMNTVTLCPCCKKPGRMRPHIVWFGEMPLDMDLIYRLLDECDLFISIGTSGNVYPAAGFVQEVRARGRAHTAELNMEPSLGHSLFKEKIYGAATQIVPHYINRLRNGEII